jgi:hypothetical protein
MSRANVGHYLAQVYYNPYSETHLLRVFIVRLKNMTWDVTSQRWEGDLAQEYHNINDAYEKGVSFSISYFKAEEDLSDTLSEAKKKVIAQVFEAKK